MAFEANRSIDALHPEMAARVKAFLAKVKEAGIGNLIVTETLRTKQRQLFLYSKGRIIPKSLEMKYIGYDDAAIDSRPKEAQVTWTLESNHLTGRAIDVAFVDKGKLSYSGPWDKVYDIAEACGLQSLMRMKGVDGPHLEFNFNWRPADAGELKKAEADFAEKSKFANATLADLNASRDKLGKIKGVKVKPYIITDKY